MESCLEAGPRKGKTGRSFSESDAVFQAAAGTFFTFLCGGINRSAIPSKGKIKKVNQPVIYRLVKEKHFEDLIKPFTGSHVLRRMEFKLFKEILYGYFLDRRCFFPFLLRLFGFFLGGWTGSERLFLSESHKRLRKS